jgi:acyl carrier protein
MSSVIADRVYALVAEDRGVKRSKLTPDTTLSYDLGLEGDDAVEFFQNFRQEFSVDLERLEADWDRYFSAEGFSPVAFIPGVIGAVLLAQLFRHVPEWLSLFLGFVLGTVIFFGVLWLFRKKHEPQITIQDLIDCAEAGKWTKALARHGTNGSSAAYS